MKLPFKRPTTASVRSKKPVLHLRGETARGSRRRQHEPVEEEEFDEEDEFYDAGEPTMKLSHAFVLVLILHLVAVAGIFAFNHFKSRQSSLAKIEKEAASATSNLAGLRQDSAVAGAEVAAEASKPQSERIAGFVEPSAGVASSFEEKRGSGSGQFYTVQPGDTLTKIARLNGVTVEALRQANGLSAQALLRIGQRLEIPTTDQKTGRTAAGGDAGDTSTLPSQPVAGEQAASRNELPAPAQRSATESRPVSNQRGGGSSPPPAAASSQRAGAPVATGAAPAAGEKDTFIYEVKAGDNPYSIARRYGVSYKELMELNGIEDPTKLRIGQKLKIPKKP